MINQNQLITVLRNGEVIEQQKNGGGIIRLVVFSYIKTTKRKYKPIHVVLEVIDEHKWSVITAYSPVTRPWKWTKTYDEKICFCKFERED